MTLPSKISTDELLALVAGTLNREDFLRVASAIKNDVALQTQLAGLEQIRRGLILSMDVAQTPAQTEAMAAKVLQRAGAASAVNAVSTPSAGADSWLKRFGDFLSTSSKPARLAYGLVVLQAFGVAWLASSALQTTHEPASGTRSAAPASKQLGVVPGSVVLSVSFEPSTPESSIRGLLLELEAQIIAGPTQLGQYKIEVARNRKPLALLKLKQTNFVEQVTEIAAEPGKADETEGDKK